MKPEVSLVGDVSDGGAGVRVMHKHLAHTCDGAKTPRQRHDSARRKVRSFDRQLLDVFDLIVRNGSNRLESICTLESYGLSTVAAKKKYFRHRRRLLRLFGIKEVSHE